MNTDFDRTDYLSTKLILGENVDVMQRTG